MCPVNLPRRSAGPTGQLMHRFYLLVPHWPTRGAGTGCGFGHGCAGAEGRYNRRAAYRFGRRNDARAGSFDRSISDGRRGQLCFLCCLWLPVALCWYSVRWSAGPRYRKNFAKLHGANERLSESERRLKDFAAAGVHQFREADEERRFTRIEAAGRNAWIKDKSILLRKRRWKVSISTPSAC